MKRHDTNPYLHVQHPCLRLSTNANACNTFVSMGLLRCTQACALDDEQNAAFPFTVFGMNLRSVSRTSFAQVPNRLCKSVWQRVCISKTDLNQAFTCLLALCSHFKREALINLKHASPCFSKRNLHNFKFSHFACDCSTYISSSTAEVIYIGCCELNT